MEEKLREKLNELAGKYGVNDERTINVNKQLESYMIKGQLEYGIN